MIFDIFLGKKQQVFEKSKKYFSDCTFCLPQTQQKCVLNRFYVEFIHFLRLRRATLIVKPDTQSLCHYERLKSSSKIKARYLKNKNKKQQSRREMKTNFISIY